MTPGERKSGKNNDSWFDTEVKRFGEDEPYIDPDPGIPEIPGKEQRVRELEAIKKRVSAKGVVPGGANEPAGAEATHGPALRQHERRGRRGGQVRSHAPRALHPTAQEGLVQPTRDPHRRPDPKTRRRPRRWWCANGR